MANAEVHQKLCETAKSVFLKKMAESGLTHVNLCGHIADFEIRIGEVFQNAGISHLNAAVLRALSAG